MNKRICLAGKTKKDFTVYILENQRCIAEDEFYRSYIACIKKFVFEVKNSFRFKEIIHLKKEVQRKKTLD